MDPDLLLLEKRYRILNDDIKVQTSKLLKEMEDSIDYELKDIKNDFCEKGKSNMVNISLPGKFENSTSESLIRVLQAKVKVLSEQLSTLQSDYVKRTEEWKSLQGEIVKSEENTLKNKQCLLATHDRLKKQEKLVVTLTNHLQIRDKENNILKREIESFKRELAQHESNSNANDVRLNRSLEEIERLKEGFKKSQQEEKRLKEVNKTKQDSLKKSICRLEKQKSEITSCFKKQIYLISNLKKQQGILETSSLLSLTEEEFIKLLDWTPGFQ